MAVTIYSWRKPEHPEETTDLSQVTDYDKYSGTYKHKIHMLCIYFFKIWEDFQTSQNRRHKYVWNKEQFDAIDPLSTDSVLG